MLAADFASPSLQSSHVTKVGASRAGGFRSFPKNENKPPGSPCSQLLYELCPDFRQHGRPFRSHRVQRLRIQPQRFTIVGATCVVVVGAETVCAVKVG